MGDSAAQDKGPVILGVAYPVTVLASLFVAARLFSRRKKLHRWAADDYIVLVCMVCNPFKPSLFIQLKPAAFLTPYCSTGIGLPVSGVRDCCYCGWRWPPCKHALRLGSCARISAYTGRVNHGSHVLYFDQGRRRSSLDPAAPSIALEYPGSVDAGRGKRLVHGCHGLGVFLAMHATAGIVGPGHCTPVLGPGDCHRLRNQRQ
jgi:hypothetical protein